MSTEDGTSKLDGATFEEQFRRHLLADVAGWPDDYDALVHLKIREAEDVWSATYLFIRAGEEPFFEPWRVSKATSRLATEALADFGDGRPGPLALVTTYRRSDGDLQLRYLAGAEAEHFFFGPTTAVALAKEVSPL